MAANGMCVSPAEVHADPVSESDANTGEQLEGYIALHFPDGVYYVNENSIILGRDTRLQEFLEKHVDLRVTRTHPTYQPPTREEYERDVAERIMEAPGSDDESFDGEDFAPTEPRYASLEGGIATFDINLQQKIGHENDMFLPIHPPGDAETGRFPRITAISKQHLRLYADDEQDCWNLEVLGRNGAFVDEVYHGVGSHVALDHMAKIGIADLHFRVAYQDVSDSDLEDGQGCSSEEEELDSSVEESETTPESMPSAQHSKRRAHPLNSSDESDEEDAEEGEERAAPVTPKSGKPTTKLKLKVSTKSSEKANKNDKTPKTPKDKVLPKKPKETSEEAQKKIMSLLQPGEEPGRRKGPGRPPANGLMSKREMKERQKAMVDAAKRDRDGSTGDVISPIMDVKTDDDNKGDADDKANNKKRKRSNTMGDPKADNADRKKRPTPEKSPEPTEDQFTQEQLQPPGLTYVVIIYRILQDLAPQQLNLQQLYKEMKKRYPYYRFRPKPGWESSVRHTVSAHNFIKGEKDGKGYKYTYNPDEVPAPQKQKQVTAPSSQPAYPNGFVQRPPGQFGPAGYGNMPYSYGNAYQQGPTQPNLYGQNLPLHSQRPLANGGTQPGQYQPLQNASSQVPPTRNPQNSPYPINPTAAGLPPAQQPAQPSTNSNTSRSSTQPPTNQAPTSSQQSSRSFNAPAPIPTAGQPARPLQTTAPPITNRPPLQTQIQAHGQPQQSPISATARSNAGTPQSGTPAQANGLSKPPPPPNTATQAPAAYGQTSQSTQPQQPSRPVSQSISTPNSATRPNTPHIPTASEELAQGRIPAALVAFEARMKRLASNMPQRQQDIETQALDQAMQWIRDNPTRDFTPEPGMSTYTISVISNMKTMIAKQDAEILRTRQAGGQTSANGQGTVGQTNGSANGQASNVRPAA